MACGFDGRRARRTAPRSRSTAPVTAGSSVADSPTDRDQGRGQPADRLPRADLPSAQLGAHVARVEAHPGDGLRDHGVRRELVPLPRDDPGDRRRDARRGDRAHRQASRHPHQHGPHVGSAELLAARPQGRRRHGDGRERSRRGVRSARLLGARRAGVPRRRNAPGVGHRRRAARTKGRSQTSSSRERSRSTTRQRSIIKKLNATLVGYSFLMWFDTRSGAQDTGPYAVPGHEGQVLLVRDFSQLAKSDFWWSDVAADVPYDNLTAALVLDGVKFRVTDFGTSYTTPEDYLDHLVRFGLYTTDGAGRAARRCRSTRSTPSSPRSARHSRRTTATSPRWTATRRSAAAPTCTSRSFARSRWPRASPTSSTGPCRVTSRSRSTSSCRMLEGDNTASSMDDGTTYYEQIP